MNRYLKGLGFYVIMLAVIVAFTLSFGAKNTSKEEYNYNDFLEQVEDKDFSEIKIVQNEEVPSGYVQIISKDEKETKKVYVPDVNKVVADMDRLETDYEMLDIQSPSWLLTTLLPYMLAFIIVIVLFNIFAGRSSGGGSNSKVMNFGKSRARMSTKEDNNITFNEVAGLKEEKEDLEEIVDFLREPSKYIELGARIPKGVLLEGPPGTGKTLLAKAVAGEAGVPFFTISGSDFVEMFVGVGASRVRDLFADAKKNAPCIIFIDEIDAVARKRGTGLGGGHDEREQTLNQLLVEMDGFGANEGIIVMAATNRVDILDNAILRPGRFDRKIMVGAPDVQGREDILKIHAKGKPLGDDVELKQVAMTTAGFTGADLENLMKQLF